MLRNLEAIAPALKELESLAGSGGQMPSSFRRRLITANAKTKALIESLRIWAITPGEKAIAAVTSKQERAPCDPKGSREEEVVGRRAKEVVIQRLPSRTPATKQLALFDKPKETPKKIEHKSKKADKNVIKPKKPKHSIGKSKKHVTH